MYKILLTLIFSIFICGHFYGQDYSYLSTDSTTVGSIQRAGICLSQHIKTEKYGFVDTIGRIKVRHIYEGLGLPKEGFASAYDNGKFGFINASGDTLIPFEYTTVFPFKNGKSIVSKNFVYGVIDESNTLVIPTKYNALSTHDHSIYHFQIEPKKSGLMDAQEQVIVAPEYDIMMKKNDSLWVARKNGAFTILKNNGQPHCETSFQQIGKINKAGLMRVSNDRKVGFLDENFNLVIPVIYEKSGPNLDNLVAVHNGDKWGFINHQNEIVFPHIYDKVQSISAHTCMVVSQGESNIIDAWGKMLLDTPAKYIKRITDSNLILIDGDVYDQQLIKRSKEKISLSSGLYSSFRHGFLKVRINGKVGYIDTLANVVIPGMYEDGYHFFEEGITAVQKDKSWKFIDEKHNVISNTAYDSIFHFGPFVNGSFSLKKDNQYGLFSKGKVLIEPEFDEVITSDEASIVYKQDGKYGIYNIKTESYSSETYDTISISPLGFIVGKHSKFGFLNESFEMIIPIEYEELQHAGFYLIAKSNGLYGTISESNQVVQDFTFDNITIKPFDIVRTHKGDKVGTLSSMGKELLPPIYDDIIKVDWKNLEVKLGDKTEIINAVQLELDMVEGENGN